mmetsp:Transcript_38597/g.83128  ORF Transcript_38597/g.83128 Transcript_38597/m.83128 type:complete len:141 (+) Transcript_38597:64-486(+)
MTMEWHPAFKTYDSPLDASGSSWNSRRKKLDASYDFGVWSKSFSGSASNPKLDATFWKRTVAPFVVERKPRCRSIANFPGFEPSRDVNYFDWRPPTSGSATSQKSRTSHKSRASSVVPEKLGQAQLYELPRSRPTTGQHF